MCQYFAQLGKRCPDAGFSHHELVGIVLRIWNLFIFDDAAKDVSFFEQKTRLLSSKSRESRVVIF